MGSFVQRSQARVQAVEGRADERRRQTQIYRMLGSRSISSSAPNGGAAESNGVVHARYCPLHNPSSGNGITYGCCPKRAAKGVGTETQGTKRFSARVISARLGAHRLSPSCGPSGAYMYIIQYTRTCNKTWIDCSLMSNELCNFWYIVFFRSNPQSKQTSDKVCFYCISLLINFHFYVNVRIQ